MPEGKEGDQLGYLDLTSPLTEEDLNFYQQDSFGTKFIRKTKENPLVPLGLYLFTEFQSMSMPPACIRFIAESSLSRIGILAQF